MCVPRPKFIKYKWQEGEIFETDLWVLNDAFAKIPAGEITVRIKAGNSETVLLTWEFPGLKENTNLAGPTVRFKLPEWETDRFQILLEVDGKPEYNSEYTLAYKPLKQKTKKSTPVMNQ